MISYYIIKHISCTYLNMLNKVDNGKQSFTDCLVHFHKLKKQCYYPMAREQKNVPHFPC